MRRARGDPAARAGVVRALGSIGVATLAQPHSRLRRATWCWRSRSAPGPLTDAFFVAFRIPNILRRLLAEGALSTAVIPVFTETWRTDGRRGVRAHAARGARRRRCSCSPPCPPLGILARRGSSRSSRRASPPTRELVELAVTLTRVMFPYLLLVGLAALAMGALNSHHRFFAAALGPAVLNVGDDRRRRCCSRRRIDPPILALAVGVLAAGSGRSLVQVPELRRLGVPSCAVARMAASRRSARIARPAAARRCSALAAVQVTVFVNTLLASLLPRGQHLVPLLRRPRDGVSARRVRHRARHRRRCPRMSRAGRARRPPRAVARR